MAVVFPDRRSFEKHCSDLKVRCEYGSCNNAVLIVEIKDYRKIQITQGVEEYDRIMDELKFIIMRYLKDEDIITFMGDMGFLVTLHKLEFMDRAEELSRNVIATASDMCPVTIGAAQCSHDPEKGCVPAVNRALIVLEKAKEEGKSFLWADEEKEQKKTRVMIVEDQNMVRMLFEKTVRESDRYELMYSIRNADLADVYCQNENIDLILMDVYTDNGANGLNAAARIKKAHPKIKIIIVTSMPEFSYLQRAREAGVESFVYKETDSAPLISIMDRTVAGESIYPDKTPEVKIGRISSYDLSERELEILRELTTGDTNEKIAEKLFISVATVKTHIANIMEKSGFKTRTELAIKARESGLVIKDRQ